MESNNPQGVSRVRDGLLDDLSSAVMSELRPRGLDDPTELAAALSIARSTARTLLPPRNTTDALWLIDMLGLPIEVTVAAEGAEVPRNAFRAPSAVQHAPAQSAKNDDNG